VLRLYISLILFSLSLSLFAGESIVFLKESAEGAKLALYDTGEKKETILEVGKYQVIYPTISADGKLVAFSGSLNRRDWGIFTYEVATKKITEVIAPKGLTIQPSFSGSGKYMAYTAPFNGKNQIHILDYKKWLKDSSTSAKVVATELPAYYPYASAGGFKVVFHLSKKVDGKRVQTIAMYDAQKKKVIELVDKDGNKVHGKAPCFDLQDDKIAFVTPKGNDKWGVTEFDIDNQKLRNLTPGHYKDYSPRYLGDGRLMFSSDRSGEFKFYTLDITPGRSARANVLHASSTNIWDPRISGNTLYEQVLRAEMGGEKRSSFGAVTVGDSIYVVAGHMGFEHTYPPESFSKEVYRYDLKANKWTRLADKINPVHGVTVAHYNGYLYAFGGFAYSEVHKPKWKSHSLIERYDIANNKWEVIGDLPEPRSSNAIAIFNEKVYLIGGWNATPKFDGDKDGTFHKTIVVYDMKTESASYAPFRIPKKPRRAFTGTTRNGKIIIAGGISEGASHFDMLDEVWTIDPKNETTWTQMPSLPFGNFAPAMMNLNGELFMFGGMKLTKSGYGYVNHVFKLDETKKKWNHTGRFLSERKGFVQPVLINDMAALLGGHTYDYVGKDGPVSTVETFKN
jgi:N-acetylneuraminic acid mutarotase